MRTEPEVIRETILVVWNLFSALWSPGVTLVFFYGYFFGNFTDRELIFWGVMLMFLSSKALDK